MAEKEALVLPERKADTRARYQRFLENGPALSSATIHQTMLALSRFDAFDACICYRLDAYDRAAFETYLLDETGYGQTSRRRIQLHVGKFFRWLTQTGLRNG